MNPRFQSGDKSHALQTLRAMGWRVKVAKRLECVRLQRRFSDTPVACCVQGFKARNGFRRILAPSLTHPMGRGWPEAGWGVGGRSTDHQRQLE